MIYSGLLLTLGSWISLILETDTITYFLRIFQFLFFLILVGSLIIDISKTETVTLEVIVDSVMGYLLLGFAFNLMVSLIDLWVLGSYSIDSVTDGKHVFSRPSHNIIYYTFMTFTTTGYGDIVPTCPISKSLAILISTTGQLYPVIIISMLVGKYNSKGNKTQ